MPVGVDGRIVAAAERVSCMLTTPAARPAMGRGKTLGMSDRHDRNGDARAARQGHALPPGRGSVPPTPPERYRYAMAELEEQTGFSARTIRYYVTRALLPPAHGRGPTATYDLGHLLRLRAIQRRRAEGVSLEEIKEELDDLSDGQIADMLEIRTEPDEDRWRRILLHEDIELHVRERAGRERDQRVARAVDLIVRLARPVVDEMERER